MAWRPLNTILAVNNLHTADYDVRRAFSLVYRHKYRFRYSHYLLNGLRFWANGKYIIRKR